MNKDVRAMLEKGIIKKITLHSEKGIDYHFYKISDFLDKISYNMIDRKHCLEERYVDPRSDVAYPVYRLRSIHDFESLSSLAEAIRDACASVAQCIQDMEDGYNSGAITIKHSKYDIDGVYRGDASIAAEMRRIYNAFCTNTLLKRYFDFASTDLSVRPWNPWWPHGIQPVTDLIELVPNNDSVESEFKDDVILPHIVCKLGTTLFFEILDYYGIRYNAISNPNGLACQCCGYRHHAEYDADPYIYLRVSDSEFLDMIGFSYFAYCGACLDKHFLNNVCAHFHAEREIKTDADDKNNCYSIETAFRPCATTMQPRSV